MTHFTKETALVTGASRGIGRATALAMAHAGAYVLVHYGKSQTDADSAVAEIRSNGGNADAVGSDLATPDGASTLAAACGGLVN
jgi:3-oxoacyl-[acyl-carrier protein] reductase